FDMLRPSLIPGLLDAVAHNRRHGRPDVALFEIGARFTKTTGETRGIAIARTGGAAPEHWSGGSRDVDFFDLKGVVERLGQSFGAPFRPLERKRLLRSSRPHFLIDTRVRDSRKAQ